VSTDRLTVLSGPAWVGKSTIVAYLREHHPHIAHSVSVTTRPQRSSEVDGVDRHFVDGEMFAEMVETNALLEHAQYAGHWYGTPRAPVERLLEAGVPVLLEIEVQGARQVRRKMPDALLVFLKPPSWEELERRLRGRGTESAEVIAARLATAKIELAAEEEFDATIVNTSVAEAAEALVNLIDGR
jgi:guanylate kinase